MGGGGGGGERDDGVNGMYGALVRRAYRVLANKLGRVVAG